MREQIYTGLERAAGNLPVPIGAFIRLMVRHVTFPRSVCQSRRSMTLHSLFLECSLRTPGSSPGRRDFPVPAILGRKPHALEAKLSLDPYRARLPLVKQR